MSDSRLEDPLRAEAERRVAARTLFAVHVLVYLVVNAGMVIFNLVAMPSNLWSLWSVGGWGLALILRGVGLFSRTSGWRARAVEAEMARLRQASARS